MDRSVQHLDLSMRYDFKIPGKTSKVRFLVILPRTIQGRQTVSGLTFHGEQPHRVFKRGGTSFAEYLFKNPNEDKRVEITARVVIVPSDLDAIRSSRLPGPTRQTRTFLKHERYIEKDDPLVVDELRRIRFDPQADDLGVVRALYQHVMRRLRDGGYISSSTGAVGTLKRGNGDCTDYTDLLVALARAKGVPARHVTGFVTMRGSGTPKHSWAELYTQSMGWIPLDPLWGDLNSATFERRPNKFLEMYDNRNEEVINYWRFWYWGETIKVHETLNIGARKYIEVVRRGL